MISLIIGKGEIGKSLDEVLRSAHNSYIRDIEDYPLEGVEVLNICYPYSDKFDEATLKYIKQYKPRITIIHSTVPVGTSRRLGCVNSPVNGRHPHLAKSILTFKKVVAGANPCEVFSAVEFLRQAGIQTVVFSTPESSELGKLLCTRRYGLSLIEMKETIKLCDKENVAFSEVYAIWNQLYNEGYTALSESRFLRPNLFPMQGEIGGHCVIPNLEYVDDELSDFIKKQNKKYKHANKRK